MLRRIIKRYLTAGKLSPTTLDWLHKWSYDAAFLARTRISTIPIEVLAELKRFRPKSSVTLYRFSRDPANEGKKELRSFTYERGMVEFMAETDEQEGGHGVVITETVAPARILVDMTKLPVRLKKDLLNEVIVAKSDV